MHDQYSQPEKKSTRLRALVEIMGGELRVYPISDSDADEKQILDALRFIREDFEG